MAERDYIDAVRSRVLVFDVRGVPEQLVDLLGGGREIGVVGAVGVRAARAAERGQLGDLRLEPAARIAVPRRARLVEQVGQPLGHAGATL